MFLRDFFKLGEIFSVLLVFYAILAPAASARPVSYSGGTTLMIDNDAMMNSAHLHYSPSYKYSVGYRAEYFRRDEIALHSAQLNYLAKRWNQKESQGNVYLRTNFGDAYELGKNEAFGAIGIMSDFETRRYFVSYAATYWKSRHDMVSLFSQKARIGIAPYVANYGNVHTWLMLQVQHQPTYKGDQQIIATPLVRFFKGPHLVEFGASSTKQVLFNFIKRF